MQYRRFGKTDLQISEIGFGSWAIGGNSFGNVEKSDALAALARAEELGCNFVDTAAVYGNAESILGEFLQGRRQKWVVATKYSSQKLDMETTIKQQLERLKTDYIDFYQIHWAPSDHELYEKLYRLKESGLVRYVGVSLSSRNDIDYVINKTEIDGFQVPMSLVQPNPLMNKVKQIEAKGLGVIVRSCLANGFLTGKYSEQSQFNDPNDQRSHYSTEKIASLVSNARNFDCLTSENLSLTQTAINYTLAIAQVSSVILSTKNDTQASENFLASQDHALTDEQLAKIHQIQKSMGVLDYSLKENFRYWLSGLKQKLK
ncbi:aldo/keto reductase [Aliikangiella sp. G2MR2-5]|uniref:aldo/keto reductase n=1 Tax=Aliikangiella sp. G2MR2-5 TaxID=2788943 RepID=UPI0018A970A2|nr:aldo/keto reductase [Aliikangiella sp. G2MR2-5]